MKVELNQKLLTDLDIRTEIKKILRIHMYVKYGAK